MKLDGKVAIVTGGGGLIGRGIARILAEDGADIVVNDVVEKKAEQTAEMVNDSGANAIVSTANVSEADAVDTMVENIHGEFDTIDILVNCAGITRDALIVRMKDEQWDDVLRVNLRSAFLCTRAVAKPMMRQKQGNIINIASVVGSTGNPGQANYAASKGGLIALTKTTARELAGRNIRCNAVAPGFIETSMTKELDEETREQWVEKIPLGRPGTVQDVADVVAFLAGERASFVTGQVINVCGGMVV